MIEMEGEPEMFDVHVHEKLGGTVKVKISEAARGEVRGEITVTVAFTDHPPNVIQQRMNELCGAGIAVARTGKAGLPAF